MSKNKNFTLNIPGVDNEISLPFDKVEEWMMVMNHMDKSGISEEETRRIVIEEFLRFQKEKEDERTLRQRFYPSGDASTVKVLHDINDNVIPAAKTLDCDKDKHPASIRDSAHPNLIVNKNSAATPLSPIDLLNNASKVAAQDLEVKKNCQNTRYPIFVSSDDIVTIYPSHLVEKFMKSHANKKSNSDDSSLLLITLCILGVGIGVLYFMKCKGFYPTRPVFT